MTITNILQGLTTGSLKIVDHTNTLSPSTPTLELPDPFPNLIDFSTETVSEYNEPGPFWKHQNIHTGEHVGTHIDAPVHWISGRDGHDVSTLPVERLFGPAVVLDLTEKVEQDPDYLIQISDIQE